MEALHQEHRVLAVEQPLESPLVFNKSYEKITGVRCPICGDSHPICPSVVLRCCNPNAIPCGRAGCKGMIRIMWRD